VETWIASGKDATPAIRKISVDGVAE